MCKNSCYRCGKDFKYPCQLKIHLKTKKPCPTTYLDIDRVELLTDTGLIKYQDDFIVKYNEINNKSLKDTFINSNGIKYKTITTRKPTKTKAELLEEIKYKFHNAHFGYFHDYTSPYCQTPFDGMICNDLRKKIGEDFVDTLDMLVKKMLIMRMNEIVKVLNNNIKKPDYENKVIIGEDGRITIRTIRNFETNYYVILDKPGELDNNLLVEKIEEIEILYPNRENGETFFIDLAAEKWMRSLEEAENRRLERKEMKNV